MKRLRDSSEIQEAGRLFEELIAQSAVVVAPEKGQKAPARRPRPASAVRPPLPEPETGGQYRGDRLLQTLYAMCRRGGFQGGVLADSDGLALAVYNSPVADEAIAAFTTVLGEALEKAGKLLQEADANNISMDINYLDKAVLRRFHIHDLPYYLMLICPQETDERAEVELTVDQITSILGRS